MWAALDSSSSPRRSSSSTPRSSNPGLTRRGHLGVSRARDCRDDQLGLAGALGPLERRAGVGQRRPASAWSKRRGSEAENPRRANVVTDRLGEPLVAELDRLSGYPLYVCASSKMMSARSAPAGASARSCSRIATACSTSPARRRKCAARKRRRLVEAGSPGVSSAASSQSSAAAGAPHAPPRARRPSPARRRFQRLGRLRRAPDGGRAPRRPTQRQPIFDARPGASRAARARSRSNRATDARTARSSRRARQRPPAPPSRAPPNPVALAVRRGHELDGRPRECGTRSRTSSVSPGRRANLPPSSSLRLSGTRNGCPGAGRVFVRTSSRPSSSAKNGLPAVASCTRASSGRVSSSPSRSSSRRCTAASVERADRQSLEPLVRERALELERAAELRSRLSVASSPSGSARSRRSAICMAPADAGSSHCTSSSATMTGPCSDRRTQHVQHRKPDRVRIRRRLTRLDEQQRDLERAEPRRRERRPDLVEHVAQQLREPGERERRLGLDTPADQHPVETLRASSTPASHSTVFPMPASPESTSAPGPSAPAQRTPGSRQAPRRAR